MSPHSRMRVVIYHRSKFRSIMTCVAVLLCLSTMLPAVAHAQTILPVVIKLPPSFLQTAPVAKMDASFSNGAMKELARAPEVVPQIADLRNATVRATELRGLLPHQFDHHYFGLEATKLGGAFALTLIVEPAAVLEANAVNFVVLTEDGMKKFSTGVDPLTIKTTIGSPLLFDKVGNRLTAIVPGSLETRYTVVVFNNGKLPATYTLQVQGGELIDEAGQTFSAVEVSAPVVEVAAVATENLATVQEVSLYTPLRDTTVQVEGIVKRLGLVVDVEVQSIFQKLLPEPVRARRVSGALMNSLDHHYLNLAADIGGGDITLTLRYESKAGVPTYLNFWVMTQDSVRHWVQGGLAQELNMASGLPVAGEPGVYRARLRMAQNTLYTVVVFSEGLVETNYTLSVEGGILVDRYGQTREARAAEMEVLALASK